MATVAAQPSAGAPAPPYWTLDDYHAAIEAGVFGDRRVELIRGALYEMPPMSDPHAAATRFLTDLFITTLGAGRVLSQIPIMLPHDGEPAPDLAVAEPDAPPKPSAHQLQLVVEVSRSTRDFDRGKKLEAYLADGVHEMWITDLVERCALVYRGGVLVGRYPQGVGARLQAERVADVRVDLDAVFAGAGLAES